jgi:hypothetical protein
MPMVISDRVEVEVAKNFSFAMKFERWVWVTLSLTRTSGFIRDEAAFKSSNTKPSQ